MAGVSQSLIETAVECRDRHRGVIVRPPAELFPKLNSSELHEATLERPGSYPNNLLIFLEIEAT